MGSSSASPSPGPWPSRPEIIFADEPTGNLDSRTGAEILSFMRTAVREFGQTIVMVTHDPVAASYADRAVFLADGRIVDDARRPDRRLRPRPHQDTSEADHHVPPDHQGARRARSCDSSPPPSRCSSVSPSWPAPSSSPTPIGATFDSASSPTPTTASTPTSAAPSEIDLGFGEPGPRLDASLADTVASVDGVDRGRAAHQRLRPARRPRRQARRRRPEEPGVRRELGRRSTTSTRTSWPRVTRRATDDEIVIDKATRPTRPATSRVTSRRCSPRARRGSSRSPASPRSVPPTRPLGRRRCCSPTPPRQSCWRRPARSTRSPSPPTTVCRRRTSLAAVQAAVGSDVEVITGATLDRREPGSARRQTSPASTRSCWSSPSSPCSSVRSSSTTPSRSPSPSAPGRWRCCGRSVRPAVR